MDATPRASTPAKPHRPWYTVLYIQVLIAIAVGILIGHYFPKTGTALKPLGDGFIGAFARGDLLQVLLVSILVGFAIARMGELGEKINMAIEAMAKIFFGVIGIIVRAAPIGAFGAMAFTVGAFGVGALWNL